LKINKELSLTQNPKPKTYYLFFKGGLREKNIGLRRSDRAFIGDVGKRGARRR
jgi:hypothetical protein